MVGSALAFGLAGQGQRVLALDGADGDLRAAKANFGLIWVQGKGLGIPAYQRLSRDSAALWRDFAQQLEAETGIDIAYQARGGLKFCMGQAQWEEHASKMARWASQLPGQALGTEMLDRAALQRLLPGLELGSEVTGASYGPLDAQVNPLRLLRALQRAILLRGGHLHTGSAVSSISPCDGGGFEVRTDTRQYRAAQVVIAAGLGSPVLGRMVGLNVPLRAQRGQLLVTERLAPLLPLPASGLRQTGEGTIMIGVTQEDVGLDLGTTTSAAAGMSRRAISVLPALAQVSLVRHWACLRILTPDGCPVYAGSTEHPGAWIVLCHSGVTLAALHAGPLAAAIAQAALPPEFDFFHHRRFNVSQTA